MKQSFSMFSYLAFRAWTDFVGPLLVLLNFHAPRGQVDLGSPKGLFVLDPLDARGPLKQ